MPQVRKSDPGNSAPPPPSVSKTVTKTVETVEVPTEQEKQERRDQVEAMNELFGSIPRDKWCEEYGHSLYRLDKNIVITDPRVSNPLYHGGNYLHRFEPADFAEFRDETFWAGMLDWVKRKFGGSNYRYWCNVRKFHKIAFNLPFVIEGEPILHATREGWSNGGPPERTGLEGVFTSFLQKQLQAIEQKATDPSSAVQTAIDMMAKANDRALEIALKQVPPQASPADTLAAMIGALEKLGFTRQDATAELMKEVLTELRKGKESPRSIWEELKAAKEGLALLGYGRRAGGEGNGESPWVSVAQALAPALEKITDRIISAVNARSLTVTPPTLAGIAPGPTVTPLAAPSYTPPATPAATVTPPPPPSPDQQAIAGQVISGYLFSKIRERFEAGEGGDVVAEWLDETEPTLANQLGFMPAEQLHAAMRQHPILAPVGEHPRMPVFIREFLDYFKAEDGAPGKGAEGVKAGAA
jgi:hypothetical protein